MALPSSGAISFSTIQTEFGGSNPISLSEYYRNGSYVTSNNTGVPTSGVISLSNFYNAVKQFQFTISSNLSSGQDLRTLALSAGWNGTDPVLCINNAIISGNSSFTPALTVSGSFPGGVILKNNSYIIGMGGAGGNGNSFLGGSGGIALRATVAVSVDNTSAYICGGGGGGGGGTAGGTGGRLGGGGGGGGGRGGLVNSAGGIGGTAPWYPGFDGTVGSFSAAGVGGAAGYAPWGGAGGNGGDWGTAGSIGFVGADPSYQSSGSGGFPGPAVQGDSFITWIATGNRLGAIT
jgi:hypothetical protein